MLGQAVPPTKIVRQTIAEATIIAEVVEQRVVHILNATLTILTVLVEVALALRAGLEVAVPPTKTVALTWFVILVIVRVIPVTFVYLTPTALPPTHIV